MVSVVERLKHAVQVFRQADRAAAPLPFEDAPRRPASASRTPRRKQAKNLPFIWPAWVNGKPQWQLSDFLSYVHEGFDMNALIYGAVMYKARALMGAPLRAWTGDPDRPALLPPSHPLAKLVARPNPHQSWREFQALRTVYLNLAGNVFVYLERPQENALPTALYLLRPDRVRIVPGDGTIKGYKYYPEGVTEADSDRARAYLPDEMMHHKLPNPKDPLEGLGYGLSPLAPLAQSGDVDNAVTAFLKKFFDSGTMMSMLMMLDHPADDEEVARIKAAWRDTYGGHENWTDIGVLDSTAKVERLSMTFDEMGFGDLDERNETRILGPFGVPPILIGSRAGLAHATYANYENARRACWQDTLLPELRLLEADDQYYLQSDDGGFVRYDTSDVPALREDVARLVEPARKMWEMGVPSGQAFEVVGLDVGDTPHGDVAYVSRSAVRADAAGQPAPAPTATPTNNDGAASATDEQRRRPFSAITKTNPLSLEEKTRLWKALDNVAQSHEPAFQEAAGRCFEQDKRELLALVHDAKQKALARKASIQWTELERPVEDYLKSSGAESWRATFVPLLEGVVEDTVSFWGADLGLAFNVRNLLGEAWFEDYQLQFAQPINQTTGDTIHDVLAQAQAEGWSVGEMQKHLETLFKQWMEGDLTAEEFAWFEGRLPPHRTELLARVETMRASNAGAQAQFKDWNVPARRWLATQDERTRDTHLSADDQLRGIDEPFTVGGYQLMYPLDMRLGAPPEETMNCRCAVIPDLNE